jgi:hypothetical protein
MRRNITNFAALAALALSLAIPAHANAQLEAAGSTKFTLAGGGFVGQTSGSLSNVFGLSYFSESGFEFGGDIILTLTKPGKGQSLDASGFGFGRVTYNFIGESLFIPFVTAGIGAPLEESSTDYLVNVGVGFKKFISESVSFDAMANYQGVSANDEFVWSKGVSLFYGLSIYVGG